LFRTVIPHGLPDRPWSRVATDLFRFNGDNYIVIVDYYSNFIELEYLKNTTSQAVIRTLKINMVYQTL